MGWSIRKSLRILPGVRVNLSRSGPRLSVGFLGARASIGLDGKASFYAGKGPIRYRKAVKVNRVGRLGDRLPRVSTILGKLFGGH